MEVIVVLVLICACVAALFAVGTMKFAYKKHNKSGYIIVPCSAKTENLEKKIKAYFWEEVFESGDLGREILIVMLEHSENDYTAKRLAAELPIVSVVDITAVEDYIKRAEFDPKE